MALANNFYSVSTTTGLPTFVETHNVTNVTGLAWVPEPAAPALLALAAAAPSAAGGWEKLTPTFRRLRTKHQTLRAKNQTLRSPRRSLRTARQTLRLKLDSLRGRRTGTFLLCLNPLQVRRPLQRGVNVDARRCGMITSKSPRKVLKLAYAARASEVAARRTSAPSAARTSPSRSSSPVSCCASTRRRASAASRRCSIDSPQWLADIGLAKAPDHNTLCRAFDEFMKPALARLDARPDGQAGRAAASCSNAATRRQTADDGLQHVREPPRQPALRAAPPRWHVRGKKRGNRPEMGRKASTADRRRRVVTPPAQALAGVRRGIAPDPRGDRLHRRRRRPAVLRRPAVSRLASLAAGAIGLRRRRRGLRLGRQPPHRAARHGRAIDHPAAAGRPTSKPPPPDQPLRRQHAPPLRAAQRPRRVRPALAERDGELDDQAKPRLGDACANRPSADVTNCCCVC